MSLVNWRYYKEIVIDHTKVDEDLTDFPVVVKLDSSNFDFSKAQSNGNDMRFCLKNGTILSYEREQHDNANQKAVYWVKMPTTYSSVDTTFRMYFGNPTASDGSDPTNAWDSNFAMVQHMNNNPDNAHIKDSTINGNNGTKYAAEQPTETDGILGKAQSFDGSDDYIDCGNNGIPIGANPFTKEVFIYLPNGITSANYMQDILWWGVTGTNNYINCLRTGSSNNQIVNYFWGNDLVWTSTQLVNGWNCIIITYDGNVAMGYVNGVSEASFTAGAVNVQSSDVFIAKNDGSDNYFNGLIDETRISNIVRSAAYIKANDYNLRLNTLLSYGAIRVNTNALFFASNF